MMRTLFKLLTVALVLTSCSFAGQSENLLFEQIKGDMWNMGLDFEYTHGGFKVSAQVKQGKKSASHGEFTVYGEEITTALDL